MREGRQKETEGEEGGASGGGRDAGGGREKKNGENREGVNSVALHGVCGGSARFQNCLATRGARQ